MYMYMHILVETSPSLDYVVLHSFSHLRVILTFYRLLFTEFLPEFVFNFADEPLVFLGIVDGEAARRQVVDRAEHDGDHRARQTDDVVGHAEVGRR